MKAMNLFCGLVSGADLASSNSNLPSEINLTPSGAINVKAHSLLVLDAGCKWHSVDE